MQREMSHPTIEIPQPLPLHHCRLRYHLGRGILIDETGTTAKGALEIATIPATGAAVEIRCHLEARTRVHTHVREVGQSTHGTQETVQESEALLHLGDRELNNHQKKESKCRANDPAVRARNAYDDELPGYERRNIRVTCPGEIV